MSKCAGGNLDSADPLKALSWWRLRSQPWPPPRPVIVYAIERAAGL